MMVAVRVALCAQALFALALSNAHAQSAEARLPTAVITPSRIVQSAGGDIARQPHIVSAPSARA